MGPKSDMVLRALTSQNVSAMTVFDVFKLVNLYEFDVLELLVLLLFNVIFIFVVFVVMKIDLARVAVRSTQ